MIYPKPLKEMNYDEILDFCWGLLVVAIGKGEGRDTLWKIDQILLEWRREKVNGR